MLESLRHYTILAPLGTGRMGEVFRAKDTRIGRTVAIKILPAELSADPDRRVRFEREARAVAALNHPHICTLHDIGTHDGTTYLVMEHLAGETLAVRLARGPVPLAEALDIGAQIADALTAAHRGGVAVGWPSAMASRSFGKRPGSRRAVSIPDKHPCSLPGPVAHLGDGGAA